MKTILFSIIVILFFASAPPPATKPITGDWKTIDDGTKKPKSVVHIFITDGKLYGKITKLFREKGEVLDPICDKCTGYRKDQKIIGMQIINGLKSNKEVWEGDNGILDPKNGKFYDCEMWLDEKNPNILNVRGYIGFIYRTQTWYRIE